MTSLSNPADSKDKKEAAMEALAHLKAGDLTLPLCDSSIYATKGLHYSITCVCSLEVFGV